ncbi:hypothetical protein CR513_11229, partial [Mucuna pruriens]
MDNVPSFSKQQSFSWTCLKILEDPFNCLKVSFPRIMHKLANHTSSIGTSKFLHPNFPISLRRSSTYFLWEIKIPCLEYATSIPRKYFNFPNSLISNCVANFSFRVSFSISSSPMTIISST